MLTVFQHLRFNQHLLIDTTPMPDDIPKVEEIGATSAPLLSASFFIGDRCRAYNDDYMKCKEEAKGRGEFECLKEGRKVTRCAASVYVCPFSRWMRNSEMRRADAVIRSYSLKDINTHCLKQFNAHWECLENNNHHLWECRRQEMELNNCVFEKLVRPTVLIQYFSSQAPSAKTTLQGLKKVIPGTPEGQTPVHLRPRQLYSQYPGPQW